MSYVTRSGRRIKKVNYSDTVRRINKKQPKKRAKINIGNANVTQQRIQRVDPNQIALIIKSLYPPKNIPECDYVTLYLYAFIIKITT